MSGMCIITPHAGASTLADCLESWKPVPVDIVDGTQGMVKALDEGWRRNFTSILAYLHDDTLITELGWEKRVLAEFDDPEVGLVGFGGSPSHGDPELYRKPYELVQLARGKYFSNAEDAEVHGERFIGSMDVAVLDGLALILRRELLERVGGWPTKHLQFHAYDYWVCCAARRLGYRIRLVGIKFLHFGGRTSVECRLDPEGSHARGHKFIYDTCCDVLPYEVPHAR